MVFRSFTKVDYMVSELVHVQTVKNSIKLNIQNCISCFENNMDPLPFCWEEMGRDDIQSWNTGRMLILTKTPDNYRSLVGKC